MNTATARTRDEAQATMPRVREFDQEKQPLFLVIGGEVKDPRGSEFVDLDRIDVRGVFPDYDKAFAAWRGAAQETVDNAFIKYMIVRLR